MVGPLVDLVSLVHDLKIPGTFKTVISASLLEHDPYWEKTLEKASEYLARDGAMFLSLFP